jgi:hypothetical protein
VLKAQEKREAKAYKHKENKHDRYDRYKTDKNQMRIFERSSASAQWK